MSAARGTDPLGPGAPGPGVADMVIATVPLRQDGTFPDPAVQVGEVLVPVGTPGQIVDIGSYLGEHVVYAVLFETGRVVGCLGRELAPARAAGEPGSDHTTGTVTRPGGTP